MTTTKLCSACQKELPLDNFRKQAKTKDGLQYECKTCINARAATRYEAKREQIVAHNLQWQKKNKGAHNKAAKKYYYSFQGKLNRSVSKRLDELCGKPRESFLHLIGVSAEALGEYLKSKLPPEWTAEDYQIKWRVGFVEPIILSSEEGANAPRETLHYTNLTPVEKKELDELDLV